MNRKSMYFKLLTVLLCATFLLACSTNTTSQTETGTQPAVTDQTSLNTVGAKDISAAISALVTYDNDDNYSDWKNENPSYIELKGAAVDIKGSGAEVKDSKITITAAGVYVISGKLDNGQIVVDVQDKGTVRLVLNGVEINSADNAPIYVKNAGKTILTLQDGTENFISDGAKYVLEDASTDEPNAAIFSKDSLTINGNGTVTVRGNYNNGITTKDDLKITGGNIKINSVDDGLMGRDMVAIKDGNIVIEAGGDGIKSSNDSDASKGLIAIEGGSFDIKSGKDGIQAETFLLINSGTFAITSGGGSANAKVKANDMGQGQRGNPDNGTSATQNTATNTTTTTEEQSMKAMKASIDIAINGGTFNIDSADDAIHSNSNVAIAGGDFTITAGDDGIHADSSIVVEGGKINIAKSYEGIESATITISAGEIHIIASDDGINIAGGNDGSAVNGRPGQNNFSASSDNKLNISGGYVVVDSIGDGLDSNGSIYMSGGTVLVSGPTASMNGSLDYDGVFEISGGVLIAAGSTGMAQVPSEQSTQNSMLMYYTQVQKAGTIIHMKDNTGNTVVTFAPKKEYQSVAISSPELKKDSAYTLYSGGTSTGSSTEGLYTDGEYQNGTKIVDFTLSKSVTWMSEAGETTAASSGPGGGKGPGMEGRPKRSENGTPPMNQ